MIALNDIKNAVIRCLREKITVENIYGEEMKKKAFPLFQVFLIPGGNRTAAAGYHTDKNVMVDILYMDEDYTSNEKHYEMLELLDMALRPVLSVGGRNLTIENAIMEITDNVAHYKFYLEFVDITGKSENPDNLPLMEELQINLEGVD